MRKKVQITEKGEWAERIRDEDARANFLLLVLNQELINRKDEIHGTTGGPRRNSAAETTENSKVSAARVQTVIEAIASFVTELAYAYQNNSEYDFYGQPDLKVKRASNRLNTLLSYYPTRASVELDLWDLDDVTAIDDWTKRLCTSDHPALSTDVTIPHAEHIAIRQLMSLVNAGEFNLLRKCIAPAKAEGRIDHRVSCHRWFLAPRVDRMWCSKECYRRLYEQSPEYKEQRRRRDTAHKKAVRTGKVLPKGSLPKNHPSKRSRLSDPAFKS